MLLCFDLDRTLIEDGSEQLPFGTEEAIKKVRQMGVKLAIITGRNTVPHEILEAVQPDAVATNNGGRIEIAGQQIQQLSFSVQDMADLLAHELEDAMITVFTDQGLFIHMPANLQPEPWMLEYGARPLNELSHEAIFKVAYYHPDVATLAMRRRSSHPHWIITGGQNPYPTYLTLTPQGADKASALKEIVQRLHVDGQIIAFGDSDNDLEMLQSADLAVQVGDLPLLRAVADIQIAHPKEIAPLLEQLIQKGEIHA